MQILNNNGTLKTYVRQVYLLKVCICVFVITALFVVQAKAEELPYSSISLLSEASSYDVKVRISGCEQGTYPVEMKIGIDGTNFYKKSTESITVYSDGEGTLSLSKSEVLRWSQEEIAGYITTDQLATANKIYYKAAIEINCKSYETAPLTAYRFTFNAEPEAAYNEMKPHLTMECSVARTGSNFGFEGDQVYLTTYIAMSDDVNYAIGNWSCGNPDYTHIHGQAHFETSISSNEGYNISTLHFVKRVKSVKPVIPYHIISGVKHQGTLSANITPEDAGVDTSDIIWTLEVSNGAQITPQEIKGDFSEILVENNENETEQSHIVLSYKVPEYKYNGVSSIELSPYDCITNTMWISVEKFTISGNDLIPDNNNSWYGSSYSVPVDPTAMDRIEWEINDPKCSLSYSSVDVGSKSHYVSTRVDVSKESINPIRLTANAYKGNELVATATKEIEHVGIIGERYIEPGKSVQLAIGPETTKEFYKYVKWSVRQEAVGDEYYLYDGVEIDDNGLLTISKTAKTGKYFYINAILQDENRNSVLELSSYFRTGTDPNADFTKGEDAIIVAGQKINLKNMCFPKLNQSIARYTIDNKKIASVSKDMLSGLKPGTVTVTAQKLEGKNTYKTIGSCEVRILNKPKLKFNANLTHEGQAINAADFFITEDTSEDIVSLWESSNPQVIEILDEGSGSLWAVKEGTAKITAYFGEKGEKGTYKVSASLSFKKPAFVKKEYTVLTGGKLILAMKNVTSVTNPDYYTEDESVAIATTQLNNKGVATGKVVVEGLSFGDTTLFANIDGELYSCTIHVPEPKINKASIRLKPGQTFRIILTNTKLKKTDVKWESSDPEAVSVDENGIIRAIKNGEAIIYTETGGAKAECLVTVE